MATLRSYSATVDQLGPGERWRFDEETGADALDPVGGLNGTYQGGFAHGGPGPIGDGAVRFDGDDGLTSIATATDGGPVRLGFLGDSLIQGFGLPSSQAFPAVLTAALEAGGFDVEPVVDGNNGQRSDQLIDDAQSLAAQNLDAVILVIGTNDSLQGRDPALVQDDLRTIIQTFQAVGTEVLLTSTFGLWPDEIFNENGYDTRNPETAADLAAEFEAIYPALATELGVTLFGEAFVQPIRDDPGAFNLSVDDGVAPGNVAGPEPDGVHPNAAGVQEIVGRILPDATALVQRSMPQAEDLLALGDGSVEGWFIADDVDGVQGLIARDTAGETAAGEFRIFLDQGRLKAEVETGSGTVTLRSAAGAVQPDQAFHVVLVFGAAGIALFLDGTRVDQNAADVSAASQASPLLFGALPGAGGPESFFGGTIDEVAIYHRALGAGDVEALFVAGSSGGTLVGTAADDLLIGGDDDDSLRGRGGGDELRGGGGDDELLGGTGADLARGGAGADRISGGKGRDALHGDDGDDLVQGKAGADQLFGGAGNDTLRGDDGRDQLFGNGGDDVLCGGAGDDRLRGGAGQDQVSGGGQADQLFGGAGGDVLEGGRGRDLLRGGADDDMLFGQQGADQLFGGAGDDLLVGGGGEDRLTGGAGADTFRFQRLSDRVDEILDFESGAGGDRIDVAEILTGFVPGSSDPNGFARMVERAGSSRLQIDADGQGGDFTTVVRLSVVADLSVDQLVADGNLVLG